MVQIKDGDIFKSGADIICHQVNCKGVMGAGLAAEIRRRNPDVYDEYRKLCLEKDRELLGGCLIVGNIANLFGQYGYGRERCYTDYGALQLAFESLRGYGFQSIAIPYGIGCGLAGGEWAQVSWIIYHVFEHYPGTVTIWKKQ